MSLIIGDDKYFFRFNEKLEIDFTWTIYYLNQSYVFEKDDQYVHVELIDSDLKVNL